MEKEIKGGFFSMETVHEVLTYKSLEEAKQFAFSVIRTKSEVARANNVDKANSMINKATTVNNLALAITNFMLAHPSENLKTLR